MGVDEWESLAACPGHLGLRGALERNVTDRCHKQLHVFGKCNFSNMSVSGKKATTSQTADQL